MTSRIGIASFIVKGRCMLCLLSAASYPFQVSGGEPSTIDVELDFIAVRVGEIDLFPRRHVVWQLDAFNAVRPQVRDRALEVRDADGEVTVENVDRLGAAQRSGAGVDDEMQLAA